MGHVDDAFKNLKANLEITATEQAQAKTRHAAIRDHVREHIELGDDFLTGSYRRATKTKRLKDVDIFCVIEADGSDGNLRDSSPFAVRESPRASPTGWRRTTRARPLTGREWLRFPRPAAQAAAGAGAAGESCVAVGRGRGRGSARRGRCR